MKRICTLHVLHKQRGCRRSKMKDRQASAGSVEQALACCVHKGCHLALSSTMVSSLSAGYEMVCKCPTMQLYFLSCNTYVVRAAAQCAAGCASTAWH